MNMEWKEAIRKNHKYPEKILIESNTRKLWVEEQIEEHSNKM